MLFITHILVCLYYTDLFTIRTTIYTLLQSENGTVVILCWHMLLSVVEVIY